MAPATGSGVARGGQGGGIGLAGSGTFTMETSGSPGQPGLRLNDLINIAGAGGSNPIGGSYRAGKSSDGDGEAGTRFGSGGSGANMRAVTGSGVPGGAGGVGGLIIREYQ